MDSTNSDTVRQIKSRLLQLIVPSQFLFLSGSRWITLSTVVPRVVFGFPFQGSSASSAASAVRGFQCLQAPSRSIAF